jgi:hypothetical protein
MQMIYWKTIPNDKGTLFYSFLDSQKKDKKFHFCPFYKSDGKLAAITSHAITKYHYTVKKREEVQLSDIEYHHGPTRKIGSTPKHRIPDNPQKKIDKLHKAATESLLNPAFRIEFTLAVGESPPTIGLIFPDAEGARSAYDTVSNSLTAARCRAILRQTTASKLLLSVEDANQSLNTRPLEYDLSSLKEFKHRKQADGSVLLLFGFKQSGKTIFAITQGNTYLLLRKVKFK